MTSLSFQGYNIALKLVIILLIAIFIAWISTEYYMKRNKRFLKN